MDNPIGITPRCLPEKNPRDIIQHARELGCRAIEWQETEALDYTSADSVAELTVLGIEFGFGCSLHAPHHPDWDLGVLSASKAAELIELLLARALHLKASHITFHAGRIPDGPQREGVLKNLGDALVRTAYVANGLCIKIALEHYAPESTDPDPYADLAVLLRECGSPAVGLTLDIDASIPQQVLLQMIEDYAGRIFNVHLHGPEYKTILTALKKQNYERIITIDYIAENSDYSALIKQIQAL